MTTDPAMGHAERFARLTELLARWQGLWKPSPFAQRDWPWPVPDDPVPGAALGRCDREALIAALMALDDANCRRLQDDPFEDSPLATWLPVKVLSELVSVTQDHRSPGPLPATWADHVGGRKWQQILAFAPQVGLGRHPPLIEWCAGKGHLSRLLAGWRHTDVVGLEWQASLCERGRQLAVGQQARVRMAQQDVMADEAQRWLGAGTAVAALHACGDLHVRLLELARHRGVRLTLAPCCYQRTRHRHYRPLSGLAQRLCQESGFHLTREALAMSVQETVTATPAEQRQRELANAWRLGFDDLQRDVRGIDDYLPVPSLAYGKMPASFAEFCRWAAERKGLTLSLGAPNGPEAPHDWDAYEAAGWSRLARVNRLELVRHLFRRPLELWLVLDRALWLEEAGFTVELVQFCERRLTPRNLVLKATPPT
ncbi:methyltransferase [Halomonas sp. V046]|uniref:methyltransferase n=1 Tax=Halomonas sp. V046 TaxID=3459611 RepID=UPI0040442E86